MKIKYIILLLLFLNQIAFSQEYFNFNKKNKYQKWMIRPSLGYISSFNSIPSTGYITDYLTTLKINNTYFQFSGTYFFNDNWGIESSMARIGFDSANKDSQFISTVEKKYSNDYFLQTKGSVVSQGVDGVAFKGSLGPVYKYEEDDFIVICRMLIGVNDHNTKTAAVELKRIETNEIINIRWANKYNSQSINAFCFNPSITFGYRINKNIALGIDFNYWLSIINFEYIETIENAYPYSIQTQNYNYSKLLNEISVGLGIMLTF